MNSLSFERMEGESDRAFAGFLAYAFLSPDIRSVRRAQDEFYKNSPTPSRRAGSASRGWEQWSAKFHWGKRASLLDQQKSLEFIELEKNLWLKTKDDFNKIGEVKIQNQLKLENYFNNWLNDNECLFDSNGVDKNEQSNDPMAILTLIGEVAKIFKILNEGDRVLYDRFLKSVGIESLLGD
jgi:hypothetical protein